MGYTESNGTELQVDATDTGSFVAVAEVVSIDPPEDTTETIDHTSLATTTNRRKAPASIGDSGEATFTVNFIPDSAGHETLLDLKAAKTVVPWKIVWNDASSTPWTFEAFISSFKAGTVEINGKLTADIKLMIDGDIDYGGA